MPVTIGDSKVYYIPTGPKNLSQVFSFLNWNEIKDYSVRVYETTGTIIAETGKFKVGCCCDNSRIRIIFYNYDGTFDGINFNKPKILHDVISDYYIKGTNFPLSKTDTGEERFSITANDNYEAYNTCYSENDKNWLMQLFDSPKAYLQWEGIEGQSSSFLPIKILDTKFSKVDESIIGYKITIQFKLSNDYIIIRN